MSISFLSALSLVASAPCILGGQNPPPTRGEATTMPAERVAMPAERPTAMPTERRAEAQTVIVKRGAVGGMMMREGMPVMMMREGMCPMMMPMMDAASMFLGHTGDLQLSDAQVTRLASIARRSETRMKAMRARMDSTMVTMRERVESRDGGGPGPTLMMVSRTSMPSDAEWRAQHEDDREAFSILTADQLATAWEMMRMHHHAR